MSKEPDKFQKAAINIDINSVVSAGAGSGKTSVLSERFCHLVMEKGYSVEEILTLTFTKEATVEMSSRIYKALREHNSPEAANFYKANIKTIDSYCSSVAKMGAHLYGISPDFAQSDTLTQTIQQMALPFLLEHRDNKALKTFVNTKDYESKAYEIFVYPILENSTVSEPVDFYQSLHYQMATIIEAWDKFSAEGEKAIETLSSSLHGFDGNRGTVFIKALEDCFENLELPALHHITEEEILKSETTALDAFITYFEAFASIRKSSAKGTEELKECLDKIKNIVPILDSIRNFVSGMNLTLELIPLMEEFQEKVNTFKRTSGQLTFKDIASLALCILRDYPELRQLEKTKYKAIMIDEFQDNNSQQRDLLFMLSEKLDRMEKGIPEVENLCPDKLFFVGDEKQSIYRFRGADVSVFRGLSRDFQEGNLSMATNYRSNPALIACFNTIFGGYQYPPAKNSTMVQTSVFYNEKMENTLSQQGQAVPDYEAVYHEVKVPEATQKNLEEMTASQLKEVYLPHLHFAFYDKNQEAEAQYLTEEEAEAKWVAEKISCLIAEGKCKPEEIAILFRDYKFQPLYERALLSQGIPYNTAAVAGFFADGPVNDIFAFLRLCVYPNDTIPYGQLLRSPMVNLSIPETEVILNQKAPLFQADISSLSPEGQNRYNHIKEVFEEISNIAKEGSITKTVTALWYNLGYRYETMWNQTVELYGKMYDLVFELCRQAEQENLTLSELVDNMRTYHDQSQRLEGLNIPLEQVPGVHIMTIHKSKGLEFKVVFICGAQKLGKNDTNTQATYSSRKYGITINTPGKSNYFFNIVKEENDAMKAAELRRVTYVALTRAKEQLYITNAKYQMDPNAQEKYSPGAESNPRTIWNILEPFVNQYISEDSENLTQIPFDVEMIEPQKRDTQKDTSIRANTQEEKVKLLNILKEENFFEKANIFQKEQIPSIYVQPSQLHEPDEETGAHKTTTNAKYPYAEINQIVEESKGKFGYTDFGTIAHSFLESYIRQEEPVLSAKAVIGLEDNTKAIQKVKEICTKMMNTFAKSQTGKEALESKWHKPEYEFKSYVAGRIVKGIVDLVYEDSAGNYTIIDYKTNQEIKEEIYIKQLACYRMAIAQMLNIENPSKIRCILYYLRYGKEIDITKQCSEVDLEKTIYEIPL